MKGWLASRACATQLALLSALVACLSLGNGIVADDMWHYAFLMKPKGFEAFDKPWWLLFSFFDGPTTVQWCVDNGFAPWWSVPDMHAALFRPLSSLTHA